MGGFLGSRVPELSRDAELGSGILQQRVAYSQSVFLGLLEAVVINNVM